MSGNIHFIDSPIVKWFQVIIALVGLAWGFYGNYHPKRPKLLYEIQSHATLFNKTEDLSSVQLLVDTVDVLKSNQNVSIYTIKIKNIGNQSLRGNDYDAGAFGIKVDNGVILKDVTVNEACNSHIIERYADLSPVTSRQFFDIPNISLDKDEWYTISVSILHDYYSEPSFVPIGKILGQKRINVFLASEEETSIRQQLFHGGWLVNSIRVIVFSIIGFSIMMLFGVIYAMFTEITNKRKRMRIKNMIAGDLGLSAIVRDDYLRTEDSFIRIAQHYYSLGDKEINRLYSRSHRFILDVKKIDRDAYEKYRTIYLDIKKLLSKGYLIETYGTITVPREMKESVEKVLNILTKEKYDSYGRGLPSVFYEGIEFEDENVVMTTDADQCDD